MNQEKLCRYLLPGEKIVKLPRGLPSFPVETQDELENMEQFLEDDSNLSAAVSSNLSYINNISVIQLFISNLLIRQKTLWIVVNNINHHYHCNQQISSIRDNISADIMTFVNVIVPARIYIKRKVINVHVSIDFIKKIYFYLQSFYFAKFVDSKSVENSLRKLLTKLLSNSVASNYSFHVSRLKKPFEKLKLWELALGKVLLL